MLYDPVTAQQLPKRFLGLIVCGLAIMLLQILANKDRLKKESVSKLNNALESINKQIELVKNPNIPIEEQTAFSLVLGGKDDICIQTMHSSRKSISNKIAHA